MTMKCSLLLSLPLLLSLAVASQPTPLVPTQHTRHHLDRVLQDTKPRESHAAAGAERPRPANTTRAALPALCARWGLKPAPSGARRPQVYDVFISSHELDMVEIRLRELAPVVDAFLVLESRHTFRGTPRRLAFPHVLHRLPGPVIAAVRYVVLDTLLGATTWERELHQRNQLLTGALAASGIQPQEGDVLIVSDTDKVPKPDFVAAMRGCAGVKFPAALVADHHYYSYDYRNGEKWHMGPRALLWSPHLNFTANQLRKDEVKHLKVTHYDNTSWHCSWCFHRAASFGTKLSTFSHNEFDTPAYHNLAHILRCVREGWWLFSGGIGRPGAAPEFKRVPPALVDAPGFVLDNPGRFGYLLTRDTPDAGLADVEVRDDGGPVYRTPTTPSSPPALGHTTRRGEQAAAASHHAHLRRPRAHG